MKRLLNLAGIAAKGLLKRNRGNQMFFISMIILIMIPIVQINVSQAVMQQVETSHRKLFGSFTDIYYDTARSGNQTIDFTDHDFSQLLPGFHYDRYGVFYTVYQEAINETKTLRVGFVDSTAQKLAEVSIIDGKLPAKSGEIALTDSVAALLNKAGVGGVIKIAGSSYRVTGILQDFGHLWPQGETQVKKNIGPVNAFVSFDEANRILQNTSQLSRQILIIRQAEISNTVENDTNLLRNTNTSIKNKNRFTVPVEFVIIMIIATIAAALMILILNRRRLATRIFNYYCLGLCKADILIVIRFELIGLGLAASMISCFLGFSLSIITLKILVSIFGQSIPISFSLKSIALLLVVIIAGIIALIMLFSRFIIRAALLENVAQFDQYAPKKGRIKPVKFLYSQNRQNLVILTSLVTLAFILLSFGVFYSGYFSRDIFDQPAGMLPKTYDFLFCSQPLPSAANQSKEAPFYFVDTYEKMGGDRAFIDKLEALPAVERVYTYKEINKMNVLISNDQIDPYIDAHDFYLDQRYSVMFQTGFTDMAVVRKLFGYKNDETLVGAEILTYPADVLESLGKSVVEGKINLDRIAAGEEIVLRVPAFLIRKGGDGIVIKSLVPYGQADAFNSTTFHVGDEIHLSGILTDEMINGPVLESQSGLFFRKDLTAKVGAIIRDTTGLFSSPGTLGKAFSILTVDEALPTYGLEATYSNISIYTNQDFPPEEISQMISSLSYLVPNMVLEDFQMEIKQYKIYKLLLTLFVVSLLIILVVTSIIVLSSQLLAKTRLHMKNTALLRINGLGFWRQIRIWLCQVFTAVFAGCMLGMPLSLLLFRIFGSYSQVEIIQQILYYFPLSNFITIMTSVVLIAILSAIPSMAYLMKHKNDILYDII